MSSQTERDALVAAWEGKNAEETRRDPVALDLLTSTAKPSDEDSANAESLLRELLQLFSAERAFLFQIDPAGDDGCEVLGCMASTDLDGDTVSQPERKVSRSLLKLAASTGKPLYRSLGEETPAGERGSSLIALPARSRDKTLSVALLENRFQNLCFDTDSARLSKAYCDALGMRQDLVQTAEQNDSLWRDLTRLREEKGRVSPEASQPMAAVAAAPILREGLTGEFSMIVGKSQRIVEILEVIDRISGSTAPVLVNGESGTGKELAALAVHTNSPRRGGPFVSENCGAITETLLESELFGYVKGAFTGANKDHKGLFELACGGTLFLDEVGDMSSSMQKKLLRVLQEGVIRRVGAKDFTPVDVRIISATNKDLLSECRAGTFREDLYYRLNVINLKLPALRDRREDIPALIEYFLEQAAREGEPAKTIDREALDRLAEHSWPGNIRELQNEVKRLVALSDGDVIHVSDLSEHLAVDDESQSLGRDWTEAFSDLTLKEATEQLERTLIQRALELSGGNKSLVAKTLQIPKTSLYNKINKYQLT